MDPSEKGWLLKYIELRDEAAKAETPLHTPSNAQELYAYLQPTGILYGHPINIPSKLNIDTKDWPVKERMKVILAESLISSGLIPEDDQELTHIFKQKLEHIIGTDSMEFYQKQSPKLGSSSWKFWKKMQGIELAEYLIDKRITVKAQWNSNFWQGFFHNILLFTDVIQFSEWIHNKNADNKDLQRERERIRLDALRIIALSAHADGVVEKEEERLFHFFLESAGLDNLAKKKMEHIIHSKISLEDLHFDYEANWLIRKYFLELSILTIWADRNLSDEELEFLQSLCKQLQLDEEELDKSLVGVESFVINNWDKVHYLQTKQNYLVLSSNLAQRMGKIAVKYKNHIKNEIDESKELVLLLTKSRNENLSVEEKEKVREQLIDVLKTIPAFVIITLPFTFLTLPILFKILPKSVFPSSFDQNKVLKRKSHRFIDS